MTGGERAADVVARLTPAERDALCVSVFELLAAHDASLSDLTHREFVLGVLTGAAPTLARHLRGLLTIARKTRARESFRNARHRAGA